MKIDADIMGKEVVDASGDQIGIVKDVEWDFKSNEVTSFELKEAGISAKIGLGNNKIVPLEMIKEVGDTILVKGRIFK